MVVKRYIPAGHPGWWGPHLISVGKYSLLLFINLDLLKDKTGFSGAAVARGVVGGGSSSGGKSGCLPTGRLLVRSLGSA